MIITQLEIGSQTELWSFMQTKPDKNIAAGERIRTLIKENGFSQKWVARKLGYKSFSTISKHCSGENIPRGEELERMAELLHTTTDYILSGRNKEPIKTVPLFVESQNSQDKKAEVEDMGRLDKFIEGLQRQIESLLEQTRNQNKNIADLTANLNASLEENRLLRSQIKNFPNSFSSGKKVSNGDPGE